MYCKKCGKEIPDDSAFCPECGASLKEVPQASPFYTPSETFQTSQAAQPQQQPGIKEDSSTTSDFFVQNLQRMQEEKKAKRATGALVLGIISLFAWLLPLLGYPISICALAFGGSTVNSSKKGSAIAGIILGVIGLLLTLMNSFLGVMQNLG